MANAHVETVIELVVPVDAGAATIVTRSPRRRQRRAHQTGSRHRPHGSPAHDPAGSRVVEVAVDEVAVDLVLGSVTRETLAAGEVERHLGLVLGARLEVAANPFLTTTHAPRRAATAPPTASGMAPESATRPPPSSTDGCGSSTGSSKPRAPRRCCPSRSSPCSTTPTPASASVAAVRHRRRRHEAPPHLPPRQPSPCGPRPGPALPLPRLQRPREPVPPRPRRRVPQRQTVEGNLQTLCPAHHGFKHHAGWSVTMTHDGTCHWTAPAGRTHTTSPAALRDRAA